MPHPVNLNWKDLEAAFERNAPGVESYLDLETGAIVTIVEGRPDAPEKRLMVSAKPGVFVRVEAISSREQYRWMEAFVETISDRMLKERLLIAMDGKGAFRRFKDVLLDCPGERERWFSYRSAMLRKRVVAWLSEMRIQPASAPPWGDLPEGEDPGGMRPGASGSENPGEVLRQKARDLVERLPAMELPAAIVFLEFLKERGQASLLTMARKSEERQGDGSRMLTAEGDPETPPSSGR